jgi:hypothetical protein
VNSTAVSALQKLMSQMAWSTFSSQRLARQLPDDLGMWEQCFLESIEMGEWHT